MFRNITNVCWTILFLFIVCVVLFFAGLRVWKESKESDYMSCLLSQHTALIETFEDNKVLSEKIRLESEWRILSEGEIKYLFESVSNKKQFDCGDNVIGENLRIAARQNNSIIYLTIEGMGIDQEPFQRHQPIR